MNATKLEQQLSRFRNAPLWVMLVLSAALLFPVLISGVFWEPDTKSYIEAGNAFWQTGFYSRDGATPELFRTPGYALLSPLVRNASAQSESSPVLLLLLQVVLRAVVIVLLVRMPSKAPIEIPFVARWSAAMVLALDIPSTMASLTVLSESLSASLLFISFWCLMRWLLNEQGTRWLLLCALLLSDATLVRPGNILVPFLFAGWVIVFDRFVLREPSQKKLLLQLAVFLLIANLLPAVWVARNVVHTGEPILSLKSSELVYFYRAASIEAEHEGRSFDAVIAEYRAVEEAFQTENPAPIWEHAHRWSSEGREMILAHSFTTFKLTAKGFALNMLGAGRAQLRELEQKLGWPGSLFSGVATLWTLSLLAIVYGAIAIAFVRHRKDRGTLMLLGLCVVITLALVLPSSGVESYSRFRIPAIPFLCLAAGLALHGRLSGGELKG